jgi:hypothetical protein
VTESEPKCLYCDKTSHQIPLISLRYQDREYWICPEHLPVMIHKPEQLVGKLPGFFPTGPFVNSEHG